MSLNDWAYTEEEQRELDREKDLENQIMIEREIDGHTETMKAIDAKFEDLRNVQASLESFGGINKQFALEASALLPGFKSRFPIGGFTSEKSSLGYRPAMEEISLGIAAAIAAAAAAAIALIIKFLKWCFGSDSFGGGGGGSLTKKDVQKAAKNQAEKQKVKTEAVQQATEAAVVVSTSAQDVLKRSTQVNYKGTVVRLARPEDLIDFARSCGLDRIADKIEKGLIKINRFGSDAINNGEIKHFLLNNASKILEAVDGTNKTMEKIDEVKNKYMKAMQNTIANRNNDDADIQVTAVINELGITLSLYKKRNEILRDLADQIRKFNDSSIPNTVDNKDNIITTTNKFAGSINELANSVIPKYNTMLNDLGEYLVDVKDFQQEITETIEDNKNPDSALPSEKKWMNVFSQIQSEINKSLKDIITIQQFIRKYIANIFMYIDDLFNALVDYYELIKRTFSKDQFENLGWATAEKIDCVHQLEESLKIKVR